MAGNRLTLSNNAEDKKIITFTINKEIKDKLRKVLSQAENYNLKRKSDWIVEAIIKLRSNPDYKEMVLNAEGNNEGYVFDKIYMTFKQRCIFAEIRHEVVRTYPEIRGPQGAIIRAAIVSRLTRKF